MTLIRALFGLATASLLTAVQASVPVLNCRAAERIETVVEVPATAFHSWETAERSAQVIGKAWATEPASMAWTQVLLDSYVKHKMPPTRGARGLALVHVAMYDALVQAQAHNLDGKLALSMAAARVLGYLFSREERAYDRVAFALAAQRAQQPIQALPAPTLRSLSVGAAVADCVIQRAESDGAEYGWNGLNLQYYGQARYYGPGRWTPTPPYHYYPPLEPFAPDWKPWVLKEASEFRPVPPAFGSPAYMRDLEEVYEKNKALSEKELAIAKFWVDGHGSVTPPGHWNQIAMAELRKVGGFSDMQAARIFVQLNIAQADTFIAVWDTKFHYWTARPISMIPKLLGRAFQSAILTPPFPSYVSGHAAFSGAAAAVLSNVIPSRAEALNGMADEAAMSRLYGGIHFRHDNEDGLTLGRAVARKVMSALPMEQALN